jgi:hypothetical protein
MNQKHTRIVFLQAASLGSDMDLSLFDDLGDVVYYDNATNDQVPAL